MVNPLLALGVGIGIVKGLERLNTTSHDRLVKKSYKKVKKNSSSEAKIFVDHIDPSGADGNPRNEVNGISGVPDIIVKDFPTNLILEIEDAKGLQHPKRAIEQLEGFSKQGMKRLLVVPDEEETLTVARKIADDVSGSVEVTTASSLPSYL